MKRVNEAEEGGEGVAKVVSAKSKGNKSLSSKFIDENLTPPDTVSGRFCNGRTEASQVTVEARSLAILRVSAGSGVEPITKQGDWRREMRGMERAKGRRVKVVRRVGMCILEGESNEGLGGENGVYRITD